VAGLQLPVRDSTVSLWALRPAAGLRAATPAKERSRGHPQGTRGSCSSVSACGICGAGSPSGPARGAFKVAGAGQP